MSNAIPIARLIQAKENLQRLKAEEREIYAGMYETLAKIYARNAGLTVEYPLDFVQQILRMYKGSLTPDRYTKSTKGYWNTTITTYDRLFGGNGKQYDVNENKYNIEKQYLP